MADNNTDVMNQYLRIKNLVDNEVEIVLFDLIKFAIAEEWEIDIESIKMDSTLASLGGDDLDFRQLIILTRSLDETFDIEIPDSEIEIDTTIESLFKIILNLVRKKSDFKNKNLIIETIAFCESLNSSDETAMELTNKCFDLMKFNKSEAIKIFNFWSELYIARETAMALTKNCFELMKANKSETIKIFNFVSRLDVSQEEAINLVSTCLRWVREKQKAKKIEKLKELKNTLNEQVSQVQKLEEQIKLLEEQIQSER